MSEQAASSTAEFDLLTDEEMAKARRLAAIQRWRVLDAPPDAFKPMTTLAAKIYGVPYGTVCVVEEQTTWFKEWLRGFIVRQAEDYVNGRLSIGRLDGNLFFGVELGDVVVNR